MSIENRFRLESDKEEVRLFGLLDEHVRTSVLDEHFRNEFVTVNFENFLGFTWNGMVKFDGYLRGKCKKVKLRNLSSKAFKMLKYVEDFKDFYNYDDLSTPFINKHNHQIESQVVSKAPLTANASQPFFEQEGGLMIGSPRHLVYDKTVKSDYSSAGDFLQHNAAEYDFWIDYLSFFHASVFLSSDLFESTIKNCDSTVAELGRTTNCFLDLEGLDTVSLKASVEDFKANYREVRAFSDRIQSSLNLFVEKLESKMGLLELDLVSNTITSEDEFQSKISDFFGLASLIEKEVAKIEDLGGDLGGTVLQFDVEKILGEIISKVDTISPIGNELERIREQLKIMNPMTEDSWEETKEDVDEEIELCKTKINDFVVSVQGLDLLRQVLEHRITEKAMILGYLKGEKSFEETQVSVISNVVDRAVTDQEKLTSDFFLDSYISTLDLSSKEDTAPPGDMMLF